VIPGGIYTKIQLLFFLRLKVHFPGNGPFFPCKVLKCLRLKAFLGDRPLFLGEMKVVGFD
jgi:hypothetical protein